MSAKRLDTLWDFVRHGVNIQLTCSNGACARTGIVASYEAVRWFKLHRWPDAVRGFGPTALDHFYCKRCRARAGRAGATESNPTVVDFFPTEDRGWEMVQRRLRG